MPMGAAARSSLQAPEAPIWGVLYTLAQVHGQIDFYVRQKGFAPRFIKMWAQNQLPSLLQTLTYVKFACDHAPLIRFAIRPAGHGAIAAATHRVVIT